MSNMIVQNDSKKSYFADRPMDALITSNPLNESDMREVKNIIAFYRK
jgi:hypothetical protein